MGKLYRIFIENIEIKGNKWYNNYVKFVLRLLDMFLTIGKNESGSTKIFYKRKGEIADEQRT